MLRQGRPDRVQEHSAGTSQTTGISREPRSGYYARGGDAAVHIDNGIPQKFFTLVAPMMRRPPRQPVDLQAQTRFMKERVERAIAELEQIVQQTDPIFSSPRDVTLGLWLAEREIINAYIAMKAGWWP
jgi:hypothetical protein